MSNTIHIFGGGTVQHVRNHFALCAPAYGTFAREMQRRLLGTSLLARLCTLLGRPRAKVQLHLTKMADPTSTLETNEDVALRLSQVLADPQTKVIIFNVALCDYQGQVGDEPSGKYATRLSSRDGDQHVELTPAMKVLPSIHAARPDVIVVGFKTTAGDTMETQLAKAQRQMDEADVDMVWVNDTVTRENHLQIADITLPQPPAGATRSQLMDWLSNLLRECVK